MPEIIVVSDAVEGALVKVDGKSLQEEQKENNERVDAVKKELIGRN